MSAPPRRVTVLVCRGGECGDRRDSASVHQRFSEVLKARAQTQAGGDAQVQLRWQSCFGQCQQGVNVMVREVRPGEDAFFASFVPAAGRGAILYHEVRPSDVEGIVVEHVIGGEVVAGLRKRG